jgi:hypothetical protein
MPGSVEHKALWSEYESFEVLQHLLLEHKVEIYIGNI